jgi:hypothetical protein
MFLFFRTVILVFYMKVVGLRILNVLVDINGVLIVAYLRMNLVRIYIYALKFETGNFCRSAQLPNGGIYSNVTISGVTKNFKFFRRHNYVLAKHFEIGHIGQICRFLRKNVFFYQKKIQK